MPSTVTRQTFTDQGGVGGDFRGIRITGINGADAATVVIARNITSADECERRTLHGLKNAGGVNAAEVTGWNMLML
ncbi:MAG: hypothetical protein H6545_00265 [Bacteroidales bacterium]|nr:hypothetical protein [Bacteroidales bacterium]